MIKSPKSIASPACDIVIKSISFRLVGVLPPAHIPRVLFDAPAGPAPLDTVKLPKSVALPVDDMVTNSILSVLPSPPPKKARVFDAHAF